MPHDASTRAPESFSGTTQLDVLFEGKVPTWESFPAYPVFVSSLRTFWVQTLGCKVNAADSDRIAVYLKKYGLTPVDEAQKADIRVINSCSVTVAAGSQSRAATRKAARQSPAKVILTGCWATSNTEEAAALPGVNAVITHKQSLETELDRHLRDWGLSRRTELPQLGRQTARQRAYLKIQDGCDAHCSYCIIPQLRADLWSLSIPEAVAQVRALAAVGHHEVILTGIFLGAFGQTTALRRRQEHPGGHYLAQLIDTLAEQVPELPRLRLSSLEPGDLTPDLLASLARSPQVVPHFHLPLQSGSDEILRRMNRQYTADDFYKLVEDLNAAFDRPALTTDIVAGFPGEDDGHWRETLSLIRDAKFIHVHAFPFSPRPETAAARWTEEFVQSAKATARVAEATALAHQNSLNYRRSFVGQTVRLIVEKGLSTYGHPHGRTDRYFDVELPGAELAPGTLVAATITEVNDSVTCATVSQPKTRSVGLPLLSSLAGTP